MNKPVFGLAACEAIATILGDINAEGFHGQAVSLAKLNGAFLRVLAADNPRFDSERFTEWIMRRRAEAFLAQGGPQ